MFRVLLYKKYGNFTFAIHPFFQGFFATPQSKRPIVVVFLHTLDAVGVLLASIPVSMPQKLEGTPGGSKG